jgi:hypothetical protein
MLEIKLLLKKTFFFYNMLLSLGKNIFFHRRFFSPPIIPMPFNFQSWRIFFKRAYIPKTTSPFSGGVMGNLF